jgi:hypothetical protein
MTKKILFRDCVDCKKTIEYMPRRVKCLDCYLKEKKRKVEFIEDDD